MQRSIRSLITAAIFAFLTAVLGYVGHSIDGQPPSAGVVLLYAAGGAVVGALAGLRADFGE